MTSTCRTGTSVGVLANRSGKARQEHNALKLLLRGLHIRMTDQMEADMDVYVRDAERVRRELQDAQKTNISSAQIQRHTYTNMNCDFSLFCWWLFCLLSMNEHS